MREVGVDIRFNADLNSAKKAYDDFLAYVASHQPTVNGNPVGGASSSGAPATTRTFGGNETIAGPVMAQRGSPNLDAGDERYNYSIGFAGGASASMDREEKRRAANAARVDRNWDNAQFSRFKQEERAEARRVATERSFRTLTNADIVKPERLQQLTYRDLVDGDILGDNAGPRGGGGGSPGAAGGRAGLRRMLGGEGFRTLGRYIGAYAITSEATAYLNQQNQFGIAMGGATTAQDAIGAEAERVANNPIYQIPVVGPLGAALHESRTGDQAALAARQAAIGIDRDTYGIRQGTIQARFGGRVAELSARGDFAGQREAAEVRAMGEMQRIRDTASGQVTDLSQNIASITALAAGPDGTMSKENADKINALNAQIQSIKVASKVAQSVQIISENSSTSATNRAERSFVVGSQSRVRADGLAFTDEREAERERIRGPFAARIEGTLGATEQRTAQNERDAALNRESVGFQIRNRNDEISLRSSRQGLLGNPLAAANLATYAQYGDRNFGLIARNPQLAGILEQQRDTEYQGNSLSDADRRFGVAMGTQRIRQSTTQQDYNNRFLYRTGAVSGIISSGVDSIEEANVSLRGDENKSMREARIAAIRANTASSIYGQTHPLDFGNRAEQVGAFVMYGDRGNQNFRDLREARRLAGTATGALNDAASKSSVGGGDVGKILQKMQAVIDAIRQAAIDTINNN